MASTRRPASACMGCLWRVERSARAAHGSRSAVHREPPSGGDADSQTTKRSASPATNTAAPSPDRATTAEDAQNEEEEVSPRGARYGHKKYFSTHLIPSWGSSVCLFVCWRFSASPRETHEENTTGRDKNNFYSHPVVFESLPVDPSEENNQTNKQTNTCRPRPSSTKRLRRDGITSGLRARAYGTHDGAVRPGFRLALHTRRETPDFHYDERHPRSPSFCCGESRSSWKSGRRRRRPAKPRSSTAQRSPTVSLQLPQDIREVAIEALLRMLRAELSSVIPTNAKRS